MTLFDKWSKDRAAGLCAYSTQQGIKSGPLAGGLSPGGGMAIAARPPGNRVAATLTQASTPKRPDAATCTCASTTSPTWTTGSRTSSTTTAPCWRRSELTRTLGAEWLAEARIGPAGCAPASASPDLGHHWAANDDGSRPYYHAAEAGLPVLALLEYLAIEPDPARQWAARTVAEQALAAELALCARPGNPFTPSPPVCERGR
jgi:hypothetical protein